MKFFDNYKKNSKRKKLLAEYVKIKELDAKAAAVKTFDPEQDKIIAAQRGILLNNFRAMARMFSDTVHELHITDEESQVIFQGCPSRVTFDGGVMVVSENGKLPIHIGVEMNFITMSNSNILTSVRAAMKKIAVAQLNAKVMGYCKNYGDKTDVAYNFIIEHSDVVIIKERLLLLHRFFNYYHEKIGMDYKSIKHIPREARASVTNPNLVKFIEDMDFEKYDYIVQGAVW